MLPFVVEGGASPPSTHTDIYSFSLSLTRPPALINEPSINKQTLGQKLNREIYLRQRLSRVSSRKNSDCKIIKSKNMQPVNFINLIMCGIFLMVTVILVPGISAAAAPDKIPIVKTLRVEVKLRNFAIESKLEMSTQLRVRRKSLTLCELGP
ncbi:hypothetical protein KQX54_017648 [Cotesia glomerata]|uniref:Uncharacterized protein n=1 Tax=Cotesia glomerata TaxID=32391 RepID=A0AAV7HZY2_COTGL|nr:hypothetical protein KQX54_017648 [Cotesia glomerata]